MKKTLYVITAGLLLASSFVGLPAAPNKAGAVSASPSGVCDNAKVSAPREVLSNARRQQLGLNGFPDIQMGVTKNANGTYRFLATAAFGGSDPTHPQRAVALNGTLDNPSANGVMNIANITNVPAGYSWVGGGPEYTDQASGLTLQLLHFEKAMPNAPNHRFYSELHLGVVNSTTGRTTRLGTILTPGVSYAQANRPDVPNSVEMAAPTFVARDGYLYMYYLDHMPNSQSVFTDVTAVARTPLADAIAQARLGKVSTWTKYHNGSWNSSGIGGLATNLITDQRMLWSPATNYSTELGGTILISPISTNQVVLTSSQDGLTNWSQPTVLFSDPDHFNAYVTLVGKDGDPAKLGKSFYMYYLQWASPSQDWSNARVLRRTVTCGDTPVTTPLVRYVKPNGHHVVTAQPLATTAVTRQTGEYSETSGSWQLFTSQQPNTHALYNCQNGPEDFFLSADLGCEGASFKNIEGWVHSIPPTQQPFDVLYRCYNQFINDHFISNAADCENSAVINQGVIGYALTTPSMAFTRYSNGRDRFMTTAAVPANYTAQVQWFISTVGGPGLQQIYSCKYNIPGGTNHFISSSSDCEGTTIVRSEGWLYNAQPQAASTPLYRCYNQTAYDHFLSTASNCENVPSTVNEGLMGYALLRSDQAAE